MVLIADLLAVSQNKAVDVDFCASSLQYGHHAQLHALSFTFMPHLPIAASPLHPPHRSWSLQWWASGWHSP